MLYIISHDEKYPIKDFQVFKTQMGNNGIRIIGDVPTVEGFTIVDDDNVIADRSEYVYLYREDANCKEYTAVEEEIIPTECSYMGDVPSNPIQRQINALNNRVNEITPYTESKTAYIDDEYVMFNIPKEGIISVQMVDGEGKNVPHLFEQINGQLKVTFEKRDTLATVTISIQ